MTNKITTGLLLLCGLLLSLQPMQGATIEVNNVGLNFSPDLITIQVGDTVVWNLASTHDVLEVDQSVYDMNGTTSNGGFSLPFGGGEVVFDQPGTFYYVCRPHAGLGMKGRVIVESVTQEDASFVAHLGGANEVPSFYSIGSGTVNLELSGSDLTVSGRFDNLTGTVATDLANGAHIHLGPAGTNGAVVFPLVLSLDADSLGADIDAADNVYTLDASQIEALHARQMYINVHTERKRSGEIRGQIVPIADEYYGSNLMGIYSVPAVSSEGYGSVVAQLDGDVLTLSGSFSGLGTPVDTSIAGGLHIHFGFAGQLGPVTLLLTTDFSSDLTSGVLRAEDNTFTLDPNQLAFLRARGLYINVHTMAVPSGEIRGQIRGAAQTIYRAHLSGMNENPPIVTSGHGMLLAERIGDTTLVVSGSFNNLESPLDTNIGGGVHLHQGFAGTNGPVIAPLGFLSSDMLQNGSIPSTTFTIGQQVENALVLRQIYINCHSQIHASGELRGQLLGEASDYYYARLTGGQEVHKVMGTGNGQIMVEVQDGDLTASGSVDLPSDVDYNIAGGIHIHSGLAGQNGGIITPLRMLPITGDDSRGVVLSVQNILGISPGLVDTIADRATYINVHSVDNAPGEIRGQLLGEAQNYFYTKLSSSSEVPVLDNDGSGAIAIEQQFNQLRSSGSYANLDSDLATMSAGGIHYHLGLPGQNGGVLYLVNSDPIDGQNGIISLDSNILTTSLDYLDTLRARATYVNVHTMDNQAGSIRGQVLGMSQAYLTTTLGGMNEVQPVMTTGQGAAKIELDATRAIVVGSFDQLTSAFNPAIGGGAHLHSGGPGENGAVLVGLTSQVSMDSLSGLFLVNDNTYSIDTTQSQLMASEGVYFNVHTTGNASGEVRGQALGETNQHPNGTAITSPASGSMHTIEGDPLTEFFASWDSSTDDDGNALAYIWQLSTASDFSSVLVSANVGDQTTFVMEYGTIEQLFIDEGLPVGTTLTFYHRVLSSDGALQTVSDVDSIILTRGMVVSVNNIPGGQIEIQVNPNPIVDQAHVSVESSTGGSLDIQVIDLQGRMHWRHQMELTTDAAQQVEVNAQGMSAGTYVLQPILDGKLLKPIKFVKL